MGHREGVGKPVWAGGLCDGGGGLQGQVERDPARCHSEYLQLAGE